VPSKYDALRQHLDDTPADDSVHVSVGEIDAMLGCLPPSAKSWMWWANMEGQTQANAWLGAGRRITEARLGEGVQ